MNRDIDKSEFKEDERESDWKLGRNWASYTLFRIGGEKLEGGEEGRRTGALNGTRTPVSNRDNERALAGGPFCTRHRDSLGIGARIRAKLDFVLRLDTRATPKNVACDKAGSFVLRVFLVCFCSLSLSLSSVSLLSFPLHLGHNSESRVNSFDC